MGRLIVVDGLDGSGKTTQIQCLEQHLAARNIPFQIITFPDYNSPSSALVTMYLKGQLGGSPGDVNAYAASSFYAVDRFASYKMHWEKAYREGVLIIAARYTTSNAIHQMPKLPKSEWDEYLKWLEEFEYDRLGLPRPDTTLFLDMPPDIARTLILQRYQGDGSKQDIHERDFAYLDSCREAALYTAAKCGWHVICCAEQGQPRPIEDITREILRQLPLA